MEDISSIIQGNRKVRSTKKCGRSSRRKTTFSTSKYAADHFLKQTLYPVSTLVLPGKSSVTTIEYSFLQSLYHVCELYQIKKMELAKVPFPLNIYQSFIGLKQLMDEKFNLQLLITGKIENPVIATAKRLDLNFNLYYLPLQPLKILLDNPDTAELAKLLIHAYHYFYEAGVELCHSASFIGHEMDILLDSFEQYADEIDKQELEERTKEASDIISDCQRLGALIRNPNDEISFGDWIKIDIVNKKHHQKFIAVVTAIFDLKSKFPGRKFTDQLSILSTNDTHNEIMYPDQYLAFYWGGETVFDEQLLEWIDSQLQEMGEARTPIALQVFDRPHAESSHVFEFEEAFLQCIVDVNEILYEYTNN
jgi:hypothetical protein